MTAERLIDAIARSARAASYRVEGDVHYHLISEADAEQIARAMLRALHDHGPTQRMLDAASKLESDCARLNYGGTPSAEDLYSAMLAAELEGGANDRE